MVSISLSLSLSKFFLQFKTVINHDAITAPMDVFRQAAHETELSKSPTKTPSLAPVKVPSLSTSKTPTISPTKSLQSSGGITTFDPPEGQDPIVRQYTVTTTIAMTLKNVDPTSFTSSVDSVIAKLVEYLGLPDSIVADDDQSYATVTFKSMVEDSFASAAMDLNTTTNNKSGKNLRHQIIDDPTPYSRQIEDSINSLTTQTSTSFTAYFDVVFGTNSETEGETLFDTIEWKMDWADGLTSAIRCIGTSTFASAVVDDSSITDPVMDDEIDYDDDGGESSSSNDDSVNIVLLSYSQLAGIIIAVLIGGILIGMTALFLFLRYSGKSCLDVDSRIIPSTNKIYIMESSAPPAQTQ
jgi:hypothetical protein